MPTEFGIWRIEGDSLIAVTSTSLENEARLERILDGNIGILRLDVMLIGKQVITDWGKRIDLLAIDNEGDLHVIEIKKNRTPREVVAQVLDYGSWIRRLGGDEIRSIYSSYRQGSNFDADFVERFDQQVPDVLNQSHHLYVVASEFDASTERIVGYLSDQFGVTINGIFFRYFHLDGHEYLIRSWLIDPIESEARSARPQASRRREAWNGIDHYVSFGG